MGIIEKLGITPGVWEFSHRKCGEFNEEGKEYYRTQVFAENITICNVEWLGSKEGNITTSKRSEHARLISSAPEMLEALIKTVNDWHIGRAYRVTLGMNTDKYDDTSKMIEDFTAIIEKATGKSWEEIKELI